MRRPRWKRSQPDPDDGTHTRRKVLAGGAVGFGTGLLWPIESPAVDSSELRERRPVNVKDHGAAGDGKADDVAAVRAAMDALPTHGGTIFFPRGSYACSDWLDFDGKRSVVLAGEGGLSGGAAPASRIVYTGTGERFVSARSTAGFTIRDLSVSYTQAGFRGALVDLSAKAGDTQLARIEGALLGSGGPALQSALLLDLNKAISSSFTNVSFAGGDVAVRGKSSPTSYSNVNHFRSCMFVYQNTVHVKNAGQAWSLDGCTFEPLYPDGVAGSAGAYMHDAGYSANSLSFQGCWFGDANPTGTWIRFNGSGLSVRSCYIAKGGRGISVEGPATTGVDISANTFGSMARGIEFAGEGNGDVVVLANHFNDVPERIAQGAPLNNGTLQSG